MEINMASTARDTFSPDCAMRMNGNTSAGTDGKQSERLTDYPGVLAQMKKHLQERKVN